MQNFHSPSGFLHYNNSPSKSQHHPLRFYQKLCRNSPPFYYFSHIISVWHGILYEILHKNAGFLSSAFIFVCVLIFRLYFTDFFPSTRKNLLFTASSRRKTGVFRHNTCAFYNTDHRGIPVPEKGKFYTFLCYFTPQYTDRLFRKFVVFCFFSPIVPRH